MLSTIPGETVPAPPRTWLPPWPSWPRREAGYITGQVLSVDGGMGM